MLSVFACLLAVFASLFVRLLVSVFAFFLSCFVRLLALLLCSLPLFASFVSLPARSLACLLADRLDRWLYALACFTCMLTALTCRLCLLAINTKYSVQFYRCS